MGQWEEGMSFASDLGWIAIAIWGAGQLGQTDSAWTKQNIADLKQAIAQAISAALSHLPANPDLSDVAIPVWIETIDAGLNMKITIYDPAYSAVMPWNQLGFLSTPNATASFVNAFITTVGH
jgi:hypothetical protein